MTKEVPRTSVLRDAELSISDATLIARLRTMPTYSGHPKGPHWLPNQAADRIELLATTSEQLVATNEALSISNATLIAEKEQYWHSFVFWRAEADGRTEQLKISEAKLAENEVRLGKAVGALEEISEYDTGATAGLAYTARHHLAEIKGESHE